MRALFVVCVIDVLGFGILVPLVPYMAVRLGVAPAFITPILGIYSLCQLLAAPGWGRLSDRYGRRPILISSLAGACASYLLLGFAHSIAGLVVARVIAGLMAGNIAAAFAYASDVSTAADRAKSMGMVGAAIGIGFMLGPAIGGLLAGDDLSSATFMRPALAAAGLSLIAIALVVYLLPESHAAERARPGRAPYGSSAPAARTAGIARNRCCVVSRDVLAVDFRIHLCDLGAAQVWFWAAHRGSCAVCARTAGGSCAGRTCARPRAAHR